VSTVSATRACGVTGGSPSTQLGAVRLGERLPDALEAARRGDEAGWEELYRWLSPQVLAYLRARGAAEPEDVLGEVFVQAVRDLGSFTGSEREFRAWIFSIAHHRLIDERRRAARRPVVPVPAEELAAGAETADTEAEAMARISVHEVTHLLATLSEDQKSVLLLRVLAGLTVPEVARVVGKRPGAVKQLQRRALARLRKELDG
jgi:RNA polymerase sigma factor (sigma-70 family)